MGQYVWLTLILVVVAVFGLGGALSLSLEAVGGSLQFKQEWVRALLQVGLIAVLGVVFTAVLELFKDTLQSRRDRSKLKFDIHDQLSRSYMDVKLVRRKVQNSGFTDADAERLNEIQVVYEIHKRNSCDMFKKGVDLQATLEAMEKYLNNVANKRNSPEHNNFSGKGFKDFANADKKASVIIQNDLKDTT